MHLLYLQEKGCSYCPLVCRLLPPKVSQGWRLGDKRHEIRLWCTHVSGLLPPKQNTRGGDHQENILVNLRFYVYSVPLACDWFRRVEIITLEFFGRNDAKAETLVLWPPHVKSWLIGKDSDAGRDWGQDRGWDGWMASPTQWMWVWVNSRSWWWTGGPGVLQFMGSQRVGHNWVTELNWTEACWNCGNYSQRALKGSLLWGFQIHQCTSSIVYN